ncbi:unnamed protein product [Cercospora beticola]|nr:unnamed protein product [Cercospora beticola]
MATGDSLTVSATFDQGTVPNATIYKPLQPGQIRVLHLQPAREVTAPLVGVFEIIEIGSGAGYEALSYTWDQPFNEDDVSNLSPLKSSTQKAWTQESIFSTYQFESGVIWIHEVAVPTTANLHVALRRLRYSDEARSLWIDAICINQDDLMERSAQVACMAQVFSGASQVVAWIGEDSVAEDGQFFLRHCGQDAESWKDNRSGPSWMLDKHEDLHPVFEQRRYFRRRWCIQEMAFAQCAKLNCGPLEIPWSAFIAALSGDRGLDFGTITTLAKITEEENTIQLMILLSPWKCLDKRDAIYSIASILKLRPDCPQIRIDYSLDWPTVYTHFTRDYIQLNGYIAAWNILITAGLKLWSLWSRDHVPSETHSWVPDWANCEVYDGWITSSMRMSDCLIGNHFSAKDDKYAVACDDHSIMIDLLYLGQVGIDEPSEHGLLCNDCYYGLPAGHILGKIDVALVLRRCGERDMTFQLVSLVWPSPRGWLIEPEMHRVTII